MGELAAWKISAQLADVIVPLEAKLAASSQVHDEARHFYVMHDYLEALGEEPPVLDRALRPVLTMTLGTRSLAKKLLQRVRELEVEPVLTALLPYWPLDPPETRVFAGLCELLFPTGGTAARVGKLDRARAALDVMRRRRPGVLEVEAEKRASRRADNLSRAAVDGG